MLIRFSLIFLITIALFNAHADSNGIWTYPRDVTPGIFGEDESSNSNENYTFNNVVYFNQPLTTNHELITNSRITANDVFYSTSNIGIGVINPTNRLEVAGNIESNQLIDSDDNSYLVNPNGVSNMYRIVANAYFSPGSSAYYLIPEGTSRVGVLNANTLQINGQHTDNRYVNEGQANSISNSMLQNNAVTSAKILDNSITSSDILDGTISGTDLASSYRSGSVYDSRFVNENQANSINSNMISNNQIQEVDLEVTNNPINNYILSYDSGSRGFTWVADRVGDSTPDTIADDGIIQENEIQQNSLDDSEIQDNSLTARSLAANSVGTSEIIDGTITINDLNVNNIDNTFATRAYVDSRAVSFSTTHHKIDYRGIGGNSCSCKVGEVLTGCSGFQKSDRTTQAEENGDADYCRHEGTGQVPVCSCLKVN